MGEPLPKQVLDSAVDPDAISKQTFDVARRGFDQVQVERYLRAVSASLHDAQQREADMRTRVAKAVRRAEKAEKALRNLPESEAPDLNRQLGDDVASVLDAAHVAAKVQAEVVTDQARAEADEMLRGAADRIEQARNECDGLIREAEEARAQILEDMERRRRQARAQVERLRVGRDRLLRSYDVVRRTLDETTGDLKSSLKEAKVRGDSAARNVLAEPLANRHQLEAELADAKLIGHIKITKPEERPVADDGAPTPRKPQVGNKKARGSVPAQPKAPAMAPVLSATVVTDDTVVQDDAAPADIDAELAKLEDDNLNIVQPADDIEEVTALPPLDTGNELFDLLRIQSSKKKPSKKKKEAPGLEAPGLEAPGLEAPGLAAQRDAVIADAAKQLEKRLKRALADEQNDLLASIRSAKKRKNLALTGVVGDLDTHISRYVVAIHEVAVVTYGAGAALVDAQPEQGHLPAGAVEELLEADVVLPIRECLESLDALEVDAIDNHVDPVRAFYRQRKTDHLGSAASRLAQLLCVAGLHDAQA